MSGKMTEEQAMSCIHDNAHQMAQGKNPKWAADEIATALNVSRVAVASMIASSVSAIWRALSGFEIKAGK